jgi:hypothetical protein
MNVNNEFSENSYLIALAVEGRIIHFRGQIKEYATALHPKLGQYSE